MLYCLCSVLELNVAVQAQHINNKKYNISLQVNECALLMNTIVSIEYYDVMWIPQHVTKCVLYTELKLC
jgi:hypothetical protein